MGQIENYPLVTFGFYPYQTEAPAVFERVAFMIRSLLPEARIEHVGSTAVPNLPGKGSINILIPCAEERFSGYLHTLEMLGFKHDPFQNDPPERPLRVGLIRHKRKPYLIHVHLTTLDSSDLADAVFFREYLRNNTPAREHYAVVKERAVAAGQVAPAAYNRAKVAFIHRILQKRKISSEGQSAPGDAGF